MYIHPTAVIYPNVKIGENVYIGANCIIGAPAEHKKYWGEQDYTVEIKDNAVIHGNVTIDSGTIQNTIIEEGVWLMKGVHIGHDALIKKDAVLSPHVIVGGHCVVGEKTNMGMGSIVHQRKEIPEGCMIGMGAIITKKTELKDVSKYVGNPARYIGSNER